jgi:hypothetical protein
MAKPVGKDRVLGAKSGIGIPELNLLFRQSRELENSSIAR